MISTWSFHIFMCDEMRRPEDLTHREVQAAYDRYSDLWTRHEEWGIDGVFYAEHHFSSLFLAPSPHLLVASAAARTARLRFGVLGSVVAMHDGRRFAEECAMLDHLTGGRFEPGVAPGAGDVEAVMSGLASEDVRPRYHSAAELLQKSIDGAYVTHQDAYSHLDRVPVVPRLRPGVPIWTTAMSPSSAAWAGSRGWKMCTAWVPQTHAAALAEAYRTAADAAGHPSGTDMLGLRRRVFLAPTDAEAQDLADGALDLLDEAAKIEGSAFETADPKVRALMNQPDDVVIGSPETVAERLVDQARHGGFGTVAAWTDFKLFRHGDLVRSHELLGREVAPTLRSASLEKAGAGA